ncbi:hypothetical protein Tco_0608227 [Tanacetum coccineum]
MICNHLETSKDVYSKNKIIAVTSLKIMEFFGYKHLEEITVRRQDDVLYKFQEGDFKRLCRKDIKDMLLLVQERLEDLQLAVESYQKKINLTKPDTYRTDLRKMTPYTAYRDIQGIIYQDDMDRNPGNPVKVILLKLNLANHRKLKDREYFENNDLKAQLQDKDTTICKLKDIIKSMREKSKEENVNYDYCELETKNVELENSVAKLLSENEHLCKEINHVKQVFKVQFDSIKKTRVRTKEHSDSLIDKLNLKSAENEDLKAQIQDKVFVITSLKNDLRKVKGKEIVDIAAQIPSANTIVPGMFKLDLEPLAPRLLQNREAHIDYLKYTQEQADILWEIVEQAKAKQPLDNELDFACKHAQRIQESNCLCSRYMP